MTSSSLIIIPSQVDVPKTRLEQLASDNDNLYREILNIEITRRENTQNIVDRIKQLASNMEEELIIKDRKQDIQFICSKIIKKLHEMDLDIHRKTAYYHLDDKYKQKSRDFSGRNHAPIESKIELEEPSMIFEEHKQNIMNLKYMDPGLVTQDHLHQLTELTEDAGVFLVNTCKARGIEYNPKEDQLDRNKKNSKFNYPKYKINKPEPVHTDLSNEVLELERAVGKLRLSVIQYPPSQEDGTYFARGVRKLREFIDPFIDAKYHSDWLMWFDNMFKLKYYTINAVARQSEIELDSGEKRGITREAINDFKEYGMEWFGKFVYHLPGMLDMCLYYKKWTLKPKYELTKNLEPKMQHLA